MPGARPLCEQSSGVGAAEDAGAHHVRDSEAIPKQPLATVNRILGCTSSFGETLARRGIRGIFGGVSDPAKQGRLELGHRE